MGNGKISEIRAASAANGTALSTTLAYIQLPRGTDRIECIFRNFAGGAVAARYLLNPWLIVLKTDSDLTGAVDYSDAAQDADTGTRVALGGLSTAADGDYVYAGSHLPFSGLRVDVQDVNAVASVMTVNYWNGAAWVTTSATDGTAPGGATLAQDGSITWTVPATWRAETLVKINDPAPGRYVPYRDQKLYWVRIQVSAALTIPTTANSILAINRSTAYAEVGSGVVEPVIYEISQGLGGTGCIQAATDQGTANLMVNAVSDGGFA